MQSCSTHEIIQQQITKNWTWTVNKRYHNNSTNALYHTPKQQSNGRLEQAKTQREEQKSIEQIRIRISKSNFLLSYMSTIWWFLSVFRLVHCHTWYTQKTIDMHCKWSNDASKKIIIIEITLEVSSSIVVSTIKCFVIFLWFFPGFFVIVFRKIVLCIMFGFFSSNVWYPTGNPIISFTRMNWPKCWLKIRCACAFSLTTVASEYLKHLYLTRSSICRWFVHFKKPIKSYSV